MAGTNPGSSFLLLPVASRELGTLQFTWSRDLGKLEFPSLSRKLGTCIFRDRPVPSRPVPEIRHAPYDTVRTFWLLTHICVIDLLVWKYASRWVCHTSTKIYRKMVRQTNFSVIFIPLAKILLGQNFHDSSTELIVAKHVTRSFILVWLVRACCVGFLQKV